MKKECSIPISVRKLKKEDVTFKNVCGTIAIFISLLVLLCVCEMDTGAGRSQIIIAAVTILTLAFVVALYCLAKIKFHQWVFVFLLLSGGLSLLIQPILNIPDETTHFARAEMISEGKFIVNPEDTEYYVIQSVKDMQNNVKISYTQTELKGERIDYTEAEVTHVAASNLTFLYLPQSIGVAIAKLLNLEVIWMLWLGRFMNLIVYCILISMAIKLADKWKFILFYVACLPMSIQQAASFSPDALINGLSILLIGYFIHLHCKEDQSITKKELVCFLGLSILIPLAKITNIFIAGLILLLPMKNIEKKKSIIIKGGVIALVCIIGGCYYLYTTRFATSLEHYEYLQLMKVNAGEQIHYILSNTNIWLKNFISSLGNQFNEIIKTLNNFGWLEYGHSILDFLTIFMFSKICFQESKLGLNKIDKILIILMSIGIYSFSCLALYISWTTVGADVILGMQGRYLIPMVALTSLLFGSSIQCKEINHTVDISVVSFMTGVMLIMTTIKYY